jgi:hypothetical protein
LSSALIVFCDFLVGVVISGYVTRNKNLRKTDSFKMMGNSSHFFGYCSVPEEIGQTKMPKSILKKSNAKPERPDTA